MNDFNKTMDALDMANDVIAKQRAYIALLEEAIAQRDRMVAKYKEAYDLQKQAIALLKS